MITMNKCQLIDVRVTNKDSICVFTTEKQLCSALKREFSNYLADIQKITGVYYMLSFDITEEELDTVHQRIIELVLDWDKVQNMRNLCF